MTRADFFEGKVSDLVLWFSTAFIAAPVTFVTCALLLNYINPFLVFFAFFPIMIMATFGSGIFFVSAAERIFCSDERKKEAEESIKLQKDVERARRIKLTSEVNEFVKQVRNSK
ncbi:hypothetical protein KNT87_gp121 [Erwinia phage Cronus]|uniref:Uncharacterized protein n=1 Tax=Erwinia phage Cronus TaxID=2163633 RepID=A0A2S1GMG1_9CAUD|nr:hypothetical protein KNT87_gp121 [Erwinia phage Cronus]AWD90560.1 hypothetical protein [Erwinia phage Cronus]